MTDHDLDTAVARATGEDLSVIRQRGFSLDVPPVDDPDDVVHDPRLAKHLDWDDLADPVRPTRFPLRDVAAITA